MGVSEEKIFMSCFRLFKKANTKKYQLGELINYLSREI